MPDGMATAATAASMNTGAFSPGDSSTMAATISANIPRRRNDPSSRLHHRLGRVKRRKGDAHSSGKGDFLMGKWLLASVCLAVVGAVVALAALPGMLKARADAAKD